MQFMSAEISLSHYRKQFDEDVIEMFSVASFVLLCNSLGSIFGTKYIYPITEASTDAEHTCYSLRKYVTGPMKTGHVG